MADVHDKITRSFNMSRIRGKDTKPELLIRKYLHAKGYRYRVNVTKLPGKPDIVLPKYKTVVFVNGCFWHGHEGCKYFIIPKTRTDWWVDKISSTVKRDEKVKIELQEMNWKVIVVWECELRINANERLDRLIKEIEE